MSRRSTLHRRNWNRYLWLDLRSGERFYARQQRFLASQIHSATSGTPSHWRMLSSCARLMLTTARGVDQSRRLLGL